MTNEAFEKSQLFLAAWKEAGHMGEQAMTAVAFALRNRQRAGWENSSWSQIIQFSNRLRYNTEPPNPGWPDLRDPVVHRFLARIDGIYDGSTPDTLTSTTQMITLVQPGIDTSALGHTGVLIGKYWCMLDQITNERFLEVIVRNPRAHPKTSTVGGLTFFA